MSGAVPALSTREKGKTGKDKKRKEYCCLVKQSRQWFYCMLLMCYEWFSFLFFKSMPEEKHKHTSKSVQNKQNQVFPSNIYIKSHKHKKECKQAGI